jgi:hypothetical protein
MKITCEGKQVARAGRARVARWLSVAGLLLGIVPLSGCTAIGFTLGAGIDYLSNGKTPERFNGLRPGQHVKVRLHDGRSMRGTYAGPGMLAAAAYASRVSSWERQTDAAERHVPALGEPVQLENWDATTRGRFAGFAADGVRLYRDDTTGTRLVPYGTFESVVDTAGHATPAAWFRGLGNTGRLPLVTTARIIVGNQVLAVPWGEIERVDAPAPRGGKVFLGLLGLALDVTVFSYVATHPYYN